MDQLQHPLGNYSTTSGTLVAGTTTTVTTSTIVNCVIKGRTYIKAAASNAATPTTDIRTGAAFVGITANQGTVVILGYAASGATIVAAQGSVEALDVQGNFINAPQLPAGGLGDLYAPFGAIVLKGASNLSGTWTFGSSNLSSVTGMTYTFINLSTYPARPFVS